jgi:hypothetical protein
VKRPKGEEFNVLSAAYWFPQIWANSGTLGPVALPETRFSRLPANYWPVLDGLPPRGWDRMLAELDRGAKAVGGYPVFVRSDLASAKHRGVTAIRASSAADLPELAQGIVEDNAIKDLDPAFLVVRPWIEIRSRFNAFHGLPIGAEWRVFATASRVICEHFYWPEDAIHFSRVAAAEPPGWREMLAELKRERPPPAIGPAAVRAARLCGRAKSWSVDFAQDVSGRVWLIDMATADRSSHPWSGCELPNNHRSAESESRYLELLQQAEGTD